MLFEEWEINLIIDCVEKENNVINESVVGKLKRLQSSSNNKRYTFRSTDWLSEAGKKRVGKRKTEYVEGGLL